MNNIEKAYCKHDLNVLFGETVDLESNFPDNYLDNLFDTAKSLTKNYYFNATKSELEEYAKKLKMRHKLYDLKFPSEIYSPDGKILYTECIYSALKDFGFVTIPLICGSFKCIALNGFDSICDEDILQIGNIISSDTDAFYYEGSSISTVLKKKWGFWSAEDEKDREIALQLADEDYIVLFEDEVNLARFMIENDIYAIIQI